MKMEKEPKKLVFGATPIFLLLSLPLLFLGVDFFVGNKIPFDRWMQYFSISESSFGGGRAINRTIEEQQFMKFHLARLVRGEDRRNLDATGFACDKSVHSYVCVSSKPVTILVSNMTIYVPSDRDEPTVAVRPYARQEETLKDITPVNMVRYSTNTTQPPPACDFHHQVPAVIFSSASTGNIFHEMNEIIIPLYITTKHFQSRVQFILEDYKQSFINKYGVVLSHLSEHDVINPADNLTAAHCFPASIVGLRYHDNLALNSTEIPGGYSMPDFKQFLRQVFNLKFSHVSQIPKPRLMLLSRTNTRRFLNEEELIALIKEIGFQIIVIRRSKIVSNLTRFSQLINSCGVLVGAHGAGLTNEIFLPAGGVMIQVELLGTGWGSDTYYGNTARAMGVRYLRYRIEAGESSLQKLYGENSTVVTDPDSVYRNGGYRAARTVFLDQQNVRVNLVRFRETLVEAFSIITDWGGK
ncbi:hypothetical protein ABFS82_13G165900 [Erythranthe guttata]|uniref:Glycosyltransferase 61 catalytic domain-containing protein n=1 Tax=Erythranthe guttata TaxID=4155 RepID=A0A022QIC0_ERYGU|nr:PREDICTED: uncharacterized protein LOC105969206 [Erythranthe guttata]EYU27364.1 hypothetical protein MIMGU_mgv1a005861mg [Erythranthe guttata]|eukprot:XP_012849411.1 PREDICTED: uncharacterized protein LOC105969206 [Erythranthe guttata]